MPHSRCFCFSTASRKISGVDFVVVKDFIRSDNGRVFFHVPFDVKGVFLVIVREVLVPGMLCNIVLATAASNDTLYEFLSVP